MACNAAQMTAFDKALADGESLLAPSEQFSCSVATALDPSGATAICGEIDAVGNIIGTVFTVTQDAASIQALCKRAPSAAASTTLNAALTNRTFFAKRGILKR